jgi:hypothetical protein
MNLFRSEEHVRRWDRFDSSTADGVRPVAVWAELFKLPAFSERLSPDYLEKLPGYLEELFGSVSQMGDSGYWALPEPPADG